MKQIMFFVAACALTVVASPSGEFVRKAREMYAQDNFSAYTNTIVTQFLGKAQDMFDKPSTDDVVTWINVDGARNVRDIGGWNSLRTERVYRGSELNAVTNHGLALSPAGLDVMRHKLKIASDLDLRGVNRRERADYVTVSRLGADVKLLDHAIGNYMSMFSQTNKYAATLREFTIAENYPIYMHCWGGADRTGTVAFILEGLCGVSEVDLAIDFELTSFAIFGKRLRCSNSKKGYNYKGIIERIKEYEGATLQEKFADYAQRTLGLTQAEIAAIRANLCK